MSKFANNNKFCFACGKSLRKNSGGYDPATMKTYCVDARRCNERNPNYYGIRVELIPMVKEDILLALRKYYDDPSVAEMFDKTLGKSSSVRLNPAIVMHLMKFAQEHNISSLNATVVEILEQHVLQNNLDHVDLIGCPWDSSVRESAFGRNKTKLKITPAVNPEEEETKPKPQLIEVQKPEPKPVEPVYEEPEVRISEEDLEEEAKKKPKVTRMDEWRV